MLIHPLFDQLSRLGLYGMLEALKEQQQSIDIESMRFEDRLSLLIDREVSNRENRKTAMRLKQARMRQEASVEDIDFRYSRGLDRMLFMQLSDCRWIKDRLNVLIIGPTGIGKTYLACALVHQACRKGYRSQYYRLPRLLQELMIAKSDGRYAKLIASMAKQDLIVFDDWGVSPFSREHQQDILEILEDRYARRSTLVTSQLPVSEWHKIQEDPTLADAILDRMVHNAHKVVLKGDSMRRTRSPLHLDSVKSSNNDSLDMNRCSQPAVPAG